MKRPGERLTLTYHGGALGFPPADPFEPGDILETTTGRRYEVLEAAPVIRRDGGGTKQRLNCRVMRPGERVADDARIFALQWLTRKRDK